jgi:hypothetical protein
MGAEKGSIILARPWGKVGREFTTPNAYENIIRTNCFLGPF